MKPSASQSLTPQTFALVGAFHIHEKGPASLRSSATAYAPAGAPIFNHADRRRSESSSATAYAPAGAPIFNHADRRRSESSPATADAPAGIVGLNKTAEAGQLG
jgi:hypothetical protein